MTILSKTFGLGLILATLAGTADPKAPLDTAAGETIPAIVGGALAHLRIDPAATSLPILDAGVTERAGLKRGCSRSATSSGRSP